MLCQFCQQDLIIQENAVMFLYREVWVGSGFIQSNVAIYKLCLHGLVEVVTSVILVLQMRSNVHP